MKNKKMMFVLLPAVILIWGLIIYRIVDAVQEKDVPDTYSEPNRKLHTSTTTLPDTVHLLVNYRDPFLGSGPARIRREPSPSITSHPAQATSSIQAVHSSTPTVPAPKVVIAWPTVKYVGMIQNGSSQIKIAILKINGKSHLIAESCSEADITVQNIVQDSVGLQYRGEHKYFKR
ncbi:hypothetical protein [Xanthocytophaga agilis]|uniref:Uncharacterized protein n=1 Tax=Xanthocytophaga agilis TaxID=3048010 RepID=A0AAE3UCV8_9BACT|nr:hypothetical protein [Xanthocytophaga agilis]MDJ1501253.1 hypothetical protein [Xanthocytophaga agilis]